MDMEELKDTLHIIFHPEPDEDGWYPLEFPDSRLEEIHMLDFSYIKNSMDFAGSSIHPYSRLCPADEEKIHLLTRNSDVPIRLFMAGLRLFADSILQYHAQDKRKGELRYYPPIILTFWSGFETFVRHSSELMLNTVNGIPDTIAHCLREQEKFVDRGEIKTRTRYYPVLDRYISLLKYGFDFEVKKGNKHWQQLEKARALRDYYTHLDVNDPRSISSSQVIEFMESLFLGIIWPSAAVQRTLLLQVFFAYQIWTELKDLAEEYVEQPLLKDWPLAEHYFFYCPFKNVDESKFRNRV